MLFFLGRRIMQHFQFRWTSYSLKPQPLYAYLCILLWNSGTWYVGHIVSVRFSCMRESTRGLAVGRVCFFMNHHVPSLTLFLFKKMICLCTLVTLAAEVLYQNRNLSFVVLCARLRLFLWPSRTLYADHCQCPLQLHARVDLRDRKSAFYEPRAKPSIVFVLRYDLPLRSGYSRKTHMPLFCRSLSVLVHLSSRTTPARRWVLRFLHYAWRRNKSGEYGAILKCLVRLVFG